MRLRSLAVCATVLAFAGPAYADAILVTPNSNATQLVNVLLGSTTGLSGISGSLSGDPSASGTFTGGPFGLGSGVVLTTGSATFVEGPNNSGSAGTDLGAGGAAGDTTTLSINFTSDASVSNLFFTYVFGSEEFTEFIGTAFNDFFSLSLDGTNFAKLACGLDVRVNSFGPSPNVVSGPCAPELVVNPIGNLDTQLDGYTVNLLFSAPLSPGAHTLAMTIGDVGDGILDSAVFVKGGTLGTEPPPEQPPTVPEPASVLLLGSGIAMAARRIKRDR